MWINNASDCLLRGCACQMYSNHIGFLLYGFCHAETIWKLFTLFRMPLTSHNNLLFDQTKGTVIESSCTEDRKVYMGYPAPLFRSDSRRSPIWRISAGKEPPRETTAVIQGYLQAGSKSTSTDGKPWHLSVQPEGRWCITASPILKRPLSSRPRQRATHESSKIRELDRGQIVFVFSVEGIVTLELASSATLDSIPSPPYRARYHSLSRLKDA